MNIFTVSIKSSKYGSYDYYGQEESFLIKDEKKSNIQILNLILNYLIFYKLNIDNEYYDNSENKSKIIKEIYKKIVNENHFVITFWNNVNWSQTKIIVKKIRS